MAALPGGKVALAALTAVERWLVRCCAALAGLLTAVTTGTIAFAVASIRCCAAATGATQGGWMVLTALVAVASVAASVGGALLGRVLVRWWRRSSYTTTRR